MTEVSKTQQHCRQTGVCQRFAFPPSGLLLLPEWMSRGHGQGSAEAGAALAFPRAQREAAGQALTSNTAE